MSVSDLRRTDSELELAHALYTLWKHAGSPTDGIVAARVRGTFQRVPWLCVQYPELEALRAQ